MGTAMGAGPGVRLGLSVATRGEAARFARLGITTARTRLPGGQRYRCTPETQASAGSGRPEGGGTASCSVHSGDEGATGLLARCLAKIAGARGGDTIFLQGEVGMGKSVFARSFIREATGREALDVVSPTFLLHETYDLAGAGGAKIQHFDLYRFDSGKQLEVMLQRAYFEECLARDVVLIEWAQYLPARYKGVERLLVSFGPGTEEGASRTIGLVAEGDSWSPVVEAVAGVLEQGGSESLRLL